MKVDIWSDVVCPWCYVGKHRFEAALAQFEGADKVDVEWRSFELDPSSPPSPAEAGQQARKLAAKLGRPLATIHQMHEEMTAMAAAEDIEFRFDLTRGGNSFDAHRLLHLAKAHGLQDALKERLDRATFSEGLGVSEHAELIPLAVEVGFDEAEVRDVLAGDRFSDAVRADEAQAREYGVNGVPFFVIDGRYGISGAQPAETFLQALQQAWAERPKLTTLTPSTTDAAVTCEDDSCVR